MMKQIVLAVVLGLIAYTSAQDVQVAVAKVMGTANDAGITGFVTFQPMGNMVMMTVNISGITQNLGAMHGIHVHQYGDLNSTDGLSAGSHWNIGSSGHGCPPNDSRHTGDTGNWNVSATGTIVGMKMLDLIGLTGNNSLVGLGVVIHNMTDDCMVVASSGARLAFGVLGVANPAYYSGTQNTAMPPATYNGLTSAVCILQNAAGSGISGWVKFTQATSASATMVTAMVMGLNSSNAHGFHVHQYGDLSLKDGTSAAGHYTGPYYNASSTHSIPGSGYPSHVGDMGNLFYFDNNGVAYYNGSFTNFGLWGNENPVLGRAVVVHAAPDNCAQPYGNAGARLAYCVIGAANPTYGGALSYSIEVPSAQNSTLCAAVPVTTGAVATTNSVTSGRITSGRMTTASTTGAQAASSFAYVIVPSAFLAFLALFF